MTLLTFDVDDDDARDINAAIAIFQKRNRRMHGALLPDGDGDLAGRVLAEVCRDWLEDRNELHQENEEPH
jgi:hypothetical protein